jgi:release factor glutamine methyltransferase
VTVREVLRASAEYLERKGVEDARLDAERLVGKALGVTRLDLYLEHDRPLSDAEAAAARELVRRRGGREPLAYVLGEWGFRGLTLRCDPRALVPRPETEVVVDRCLALLEPVDAPDVLDVGTGTGAIALSLAHELPGARVTALDRSAEALELAGENAAAAGLDVELVRGDVADGLPAGPFDLVVSNPPYVRAEEIERLAPEVRDWEPRDAILDAGQTGAVIRAAREVLRPGGWLVLETHWHGAKDAARELAAGGYGSPVVTSDLAGRERVVEGRWRA